MAYKTEIDKLQQFLVGMKYLQFLFLAIFFYGTATLSYEIIREIGVMILTPWSIGCTVFGAEGVVASALIIRSTEKKVEKFVKEAKK